MNKEKKHWNKLYFKYEKTNKVSTQQTFKRQESEQQQRNSAVKGASPTKIKVFCENNSCVLLRLIVTSSLL